MHCFTTNLSFPSSIQAAQGKFSSMQRSCDAEVPFDQLELENHGTMGDETWVNHVEPPKQLVLDRGFHHVSSHQNSGVLGVSGLFALLLISYFHHPWLRNAPNGHTTILGYLYHRKLQSQDSIHCQDSISPSQRISQYSGPKVPET